MESDPMHDVRATYDRLAGRYDSWAKSVSPELSTERATWIADRTPAGGRVLELGCGTGLPTAEILTRTTEYLGLDSSSRMLSQARSNVPDGQFRFGDMRTVEFPHAPFDAVIAFYSIIHIPVTDQPDLFRKVSRWLRPDGLFVASLAPTPERSGFDPDWLGAGPMHWSSLGATRYRALVVECGFEVITDEILPQLEGDVPVEFLWLTCRRPAVG